MWDEALGNGSTILSECILSECYLISYRLLLQRLRMNSRTTFGMVSSMIGQILMSDWQSIPPDPRATSQTLYFYGG